jgi:hypothetical protein
MIRKGNVLLMDNERIVPDAIPEVLRSPKQDVISA